MLKLSKKDLADELQVAAATIAAWQRDGLPHHREGRSNYYLLREVVDFLLARQGSDRLDPAQERARLHKSQRVIKELEYSIMAEKFIPIETVEQFLVRIFGNTRAHFLSLPHRLAPAVLACSSLPEIHDVAQGLVYECLTELAENPSHKDLAS